MTSRTPRRWLVVGLGNSLAGDDGFGPAVVSQLADVPSVTGTADLVDGSTDLLAWLPMFASYDRVVLVDVVVDECRAGDVVVLSDAEIAAWPADAPSAHQVSPLVAVRLFRTLYPHVPTKLYLVGWCLSRLTLSSRRDRRGPIATGVRAVRQLIRTRSATPMAITGPQSAFPADGGRT